MPAVLDDGDVDVDDVAVLQDLGRARDAVADDVVDRGADGLGEAAVADVGRDRALHVDDVVVADAVQFLGAHARFHVRGHHLQHLGGQPAGDAHLLDFCRGLGGDGHPLDYRLSARGPGRAPRTAATDTCCELTCCVTSTRDAVVPGGMHFTFSSCTIHPGERDRLARIVRNPGRSFTTSSPYRHGPRPAGCSPDGDTGTLRAFFDSLSLRGSYAPDYPYAAVRRPPGRVPAGGQRRIQLPSPVPAAPPRRLDFQVTIPQRAVSCRSAPAPTCRHDQLRHDQRPGTNVGNGTAGRRVPAAILRFRRGHRQGTGQQRQHHACRPLRPAPLNEWRQRHDLLQPRSPPRRPS